MQSRAFIINWILVILADIEGMHLSLDEFEFRQDTTTDYGVSCPLASEKSKYNVVNTLAPLFLIESSSFLQVTRKMKSGLSSKLSLIGQCTVELAALEHSFL